MFNVMNLFDFHKKFKEFNYRYHGINTFHGVRPNIKAFRQFFK